MTKTHWWFFLAIVVGSLIVTHQSQASSNNQEPQGGNTPIPLLQSGLPGFMPLPDRKKAEFSRLVTILPSEATAHQRRGCLDDYYVDAVQNTINHPLNTGMDVRAGDILEISASGIACYGPQTNQCTDPNGNPAAPLDGCNTGELILFIGQNGYCVGDYAFGQVTESGRLGLAINDSTPTDNHYGYDVCIHIGQQTTKQPDYIVERVSISSTTLAPGSKFNLSGYVTNQGDGDAVTTSRLSILLSKTPNIPAGSGLAAVPNFSAVRAKESVPFNSPDGITLPSDVQSGQYYLKIIADYLNDIPESNENNNLYEIPITVQGSSSCSLSCTASTASANAGNVASGGTVTFSAQAATSSCSNAPTYFWEFGDGATSTLQNPTHVYISALDRDFQWRVTIAVSNGGSCTKSGIIRVSGQTACLTVVAEPSSAGSFQVTPNPTGGCYTKGATASLKANPASGFRFDRWTGDAAGTANPLTVTMDRDKRIVAQFVPAGPPPQNVSLVMYPDNSWVSGVPVYKANGDVIDIVVSVPNPSTQTISNVALELDVDGNMFEPDFVHVYRRKSAEEIAIVDPFSQELTGYISGFDGGKRNIRLFNLDIFPTSPGNNNDFVFRLKLRAGFSQGTSIDATATVEGQLVGTRKLSDHCQVQIRQRAFILLTNNELLYKVYALKNGSLDPELASDVNRLWETIYNLAADRVAVVGMVDREDRDNDGNRSDLPTINWLNTRQNLPYSQGEGAINTVSNKIDQMLDGNGVRQGWVERLAGPSGSIHVAIIGGDKVIPYYRVNTPTVRFLDSNEKEVVAQVTKQSSRSHNASDITERDAQNGYLLSDIIYRATQDSDWGNGDVANIFVGRVEGTNALSVERLLIFSGYETFSATTGKAAMLEICQFDNSHEEIRKINERAGYEILDVIDGKKMNPACNNKECEDTSSQVIDVPAFTNLLTDSANRFDLIHLSTHGSTNDLTISDCSSPSLRFTTRDLLTIKTFQMGFTRPVFVFDSCLNGLFDWNGDSTTGADHLVYQLLDKGPRGILASSTLIIGNYGSNYFAKYNEYLLSGRSLGHSLNLATRGYNQTKSASNEEALTRFEINLFGCPWAKLQPPKQLNLNKPTHFGEVLKSDAEPELDLSTHITALPQGQFQKTMVMSLPQYQLETVGNQYQLVQIPGFSQSLENSVTPVLPEKDISVSLPLDSTVQSVSVTFENPLSLGSINIPAYIQPIPIPLPDGSGPVGGEYVNCPSDAGDFKQEFSFRVSNDVTAKRVGVWFRPVNFVPSTKSLTLYTTVKINIVYSTSSSAALLSFSPGSREVLVSSPINTQTSIENTSQTTQLFQSEIRLLDYRDQLIRSYVGKETVASGQKVDIAVSFIGPSSPGLYTLEVLAKDSQGMIQGRNQEYIRVVDRDTTAPTVKVLSPNGGNVLKSGFPIPVTWTAIDNQRIVSQEVRLSVDGGVNYPFVLAAGLPGGITKTEITLPQTQTTQARISVVAYDAAGNSGRDLSDSNFTIEEGDLIRPVVKVLSPNGKEKLKIGSSYSITWEASDNIQIASQDVLLSTNSGALFSSVLASGLSGEARSFLFSVPLNQPKTKTTRIRVVARDAAGNVGTDDSDADFKIKR